jgi:hypothetical protein
VSEQFESRYPDYDVLAKWDTTDWDDQTRRVVRERLENVPIYRFFDAHEAALLEAVVERILPQPDRSPADRVPIAPWIDQKLYEDLRNGYRYELMPPQRESWRLALRGIDEIAHANYGASFISLPADSQDYVLGWVQRGDVEGDAWRRVPPNRFFREVLCSTIAKIYYAHPAAWSECGYNGPSSPRGHVRKWIGGVDPWEAHEARTGKP